MAIFEIFADEINLIQCTGISHLMCYYSSICVYKAMTDVEMPQVTSEVILFKFSIPASVVCEFNKAFVFRWNFDIRPSICISMLVGNVSFWRIIVGDRTFWLQRCINRQPGIESPQGILMMPRQNLLEDKLTLLTPPIKLMPILSAVRGLNNRFRRKFGWFIVICTDN